MPRGVPLGPGYSPARKTEQISLRHEEMEQWMDGCTNSDLLWAKIRLAEGRLFAATQAFWNHPGLPALFPRFLIQTHCLMRSGLTMMAAAIERAHAMPEDPVAQALADYLEIHLQEELGHDLWLLDDIRTLGFEDQQVLKAQPCAASVTLSSGPNTSG